MTCVQELHDGRLATGSMDSTIRVWDLDAMCCVHDIQAHVGGVVCLSVLSDGRLASGSVDKTIRLWDMNTGECTESFEHDEQEVSVLCTFRDGRLYSGGEDGRIRLWELEGTGASHRIGKPQVVVSEFLCHKGRLMSIEELEGDKGVLSSAWDGIVKLWAKCEPTEGDPQGGTSGTVGYVCWPMALHGAHIKAP